MAYVVRAVFSMVRGNTIEDVPWHFRVVAASEAEALRTARRHAGVECAREVFVAGLTS